jgi:hypothetical protein
MREFLDMRSIVARSRTVVRTAISTGQRCGANDAE